MRPKIPNPTLTSKRRPMLAFGFVKFFGFFFRFCYYDMHFVLCAFGLYSYLCVSLSLHLAKNCCCWRFYFLLIFINFSFFLFSFLFSSLARAAFAAAPSIALLFPPFPLLHFFFFFCLIAVNFGCWSAVGSMPKTCECQARALELLSLRWIWHGEENAGICVGAYVCIQVVS